MQSYKPHHGRSRHSHGASEQYAVRSHNDMAQASRVSAEEGAVRAANLKLLLTKVNGDMSLLSAAAQVKLPRLQQMVDGHELVNSELATHIEETLALDQGWLDKKHQPEDISARTIDILLGKDISDYEKDLRHVEQKGHEIMKSSASTQPSNKARRVKAGAAAPAPATGKKANAASASSAGSAPNLPDVRIANLKLLTQARGAKSKLARILVVSESIISFLFNKKKDFTSKFARDFETKLGLPNDWLDWEHTEQDVPASVWSMLGTPAVSGPGAVANPRQGNLPLPALRLNVASEPSLIETEVPPAASVPAPAVKPASAPAAAKVAAQKPATPKSSAKAAAKSAAAALPPAPRFSNQGEPSVLDSVGLSAGYTPEPASQSLPVAPQAVAAPAPAPAAQAPAAPAAPKAAAPVAPTSTVSPAETSDVLTQMQGQAAVAVGPITEALLKTLMQRAKDGAFTEKDAYELLGRISGV